MFNKIKEYKYFIFEFKYSILFVFICLTLQHGSTLLENIIKEPIEIIKTKIGIWEFSLINSENKIYYLSLGRPLSTCEVYLDDKFLFSNKSAIEGLRDSLSIGGSFIVNKDNKKISIICDNTPIWGPTLNQNPVLTSNVRLGYLLQLWRMFTELLLGPIASLLFAMVTFSNLTKFSFQKKIAYITFAVSCLSYSVSLAYYIRVFLDPFISGVIHIGLRNIFSITGALLLYSYSSISYKMISINIFALLGLMFFSIFLPEQISSYYKIQYIVFPILTLSATVKLFNPIVNSEIYILLRQLGIAWFIIQLFDLFKLYFNTPVFIGPSLIALLALTLTYIRHKEKLRIGRIQSATNRVLRSISARRSLSEILTQIASITAGETHFKRVSTYIDGFCLGISEHPNKLFFRVMENGYNKDTSLDKIIDFKDGRGLNITKALMSEQLNLMQGSIDNAWFIVVPIGKHATINLSDEKPTSHFQAIESKEILEGIHPSLLSLNTKILAQGYRQGLSLEKIRLLKGDGKFEVEVGSIFADINDYTLLSEKYGITFTEFVNNVYISSLIKSISKTATPEFIRGDEIYLICISDLIQPNLTVSEALIETLNSLNDFINYSGAELCEQNGFHKITFSIGSTIGTSTLICDPIQVRTVGQSVNEAKRLQEASGKNNTLVKLNENLNQTYFQNLGPEIPILFKKNLIYARKFYYLKNKKIAS